MKEVRFNKDKDELLKKDRNISFKIIYEKIPKKMFHPQDEYEENLMKTPDADDFVLVDNQEQEIKRYTNYFRANTKKDKRVTIRVSYQDLENIQQKANETQIPYQTLITSVLHQFASGKIQIQI